MLPQNQTTWIAPRKEQNIHRFTSSKWKNRWSKVEILKKTWRWKIPALNISRLFLGD